jgi:probable O-glycosylation ligase (exosortase A-associated)
MRDLMLACVVFGALPFILKRPFWGILMLAWLGYMNPHRLAWGFMFSMPVVMIVAVVTLVGMLASKEAKRMIWSREIVVLVLFIAWMGITTSTAFYPALAIEQYEKVIKIQILTFMTLLMLTSERRIHLFIWTLALSLGFYGVKGGIFTIVNGGVYRVQGPPGTFIGGNNELAVALVMTIPLMRYLYLQEKKRIVRYGLAAAMFLTAVAAFGTQSRGALVALILTGGIFWLKSRYKFATALFVMLAAGVALSVMPSEWFERMTTIKTYQEDQSAQGRLNQWGNAINIANDRITGGGFETWQWGVCQRYAPNPDDCRDVHSIYFEVLGEHGYIGLAFFLGLLGMTWFKCGSIIRRAKQDPALTWARDLAAMIQVSMVAYMSGGAFLGLAYFDYIYHLMAVVVVASHLVGQAVGRTPDSVAQARVPASVGDARVLPNR